ncbi:TonB-dependent outer membrane protein, SusC/RagA [Gemmatirosa kalamazoonensis]|uniref:TonB-dependent outer membrane protein, SusC/RagA n=1 Tax=Gemmatirosa kalamazoonensis TaxID=861299 RepID=W0RJH0_9BACT|nr:SusC/RagA family TonB-linked outer membrane protein [Gemmatirosa kalamazoonensis]AHG91214.1 TonB-dependent outer membrane protein, SusC/RagA [Gemmatirosa kalamazoonensis]
MRWSSLSVLSPALILCTAAPGEAQQREPTIAAAYRTTGGRHTELKRQVETGTVSGVVTDSATGAPVSGAQVGITGTALGTTTGTTGRFTIANVPVGTHTVQVRMIGFGVLERTVTVADGQVATVNFQISRTAVVLHEIVTVGYGTQRRANVTGAVDQVGSEALENRPMANLTQGLQGVIPNVNIRLLDGRPTQAPRINVRGTTSIGQGGNALVLIDGVEGDPSMLNPNDVESISVLKDAAAAAVYGARGAFGVLLITTKKPARDGFAITYETNYGMRKPTVPAGYVTDGYTYAKMFNESFFNFEGTNPQNVNKTQSFSQQYLAEFEKRSKDPNAKTVEVGPDGQYVYYASTDWYGLLYKDQTPTSEQSLSVSRSTDKASFLISGRYLNQPGLFRYSSDDYRLLNIRATGTLQLYSWLQMNNNLMASNRKYFNPLNIGEGGGIWRNLADEGHPSEPMLNPDGTLTWSGAYTVGDYYYGKNGSDFNRNLVRNTTGLTATLFDSKFRINGDFSFQNTDDAERRRRVEIPYSRSPGVIEYLGTSTNDLRNLNDNGLYLASNLYGDYRGTFRDKHNVNVVLGTNYEQSTAERLDVTRNGLIFPDAENINLALGQAITTGGNYEKWAILGGFYRVNYNYDERYLLEFDGRYDGSSKFPSNQRYAFFPSVSAGWHLSSEPFWKVSKNLVSDLKFRGSYGSMGNGNIAAYTFNELFNITKSGRILNGIQPQYTGAPAVLPDGLTWETVTTKNAGLDLDMLAGRLQFTGDVYSRLTTDMYTIGMTLPATFGATSPKGNYADMKTNGWEAQLSWQDRFDLASRPFGYNVRVSLSDYSSRILKYNNPDKFLTDYYVGQQVGEIWGYVNEGFFSSAEQIASHADQSLFRSHSSGKWQVGDIMLKDLNGDGKITPGKNTADDAGDRIIIGNTTPRYRFGINLGANYRNVFLNGFFQGVAKQDWYPSPESNAFWGQYNRPYGFVPKWQLKPGMIWTPDNPDAFLPRYASRLSNNAAGILRAPQSKYVMNAAYVRLKNIQLGYDLPRSLASRIGARSTRVYLTGENLWTYSPLYKYSDNIDVENATAPSDQFASPGGNSGDGYNYPMLRSFSIGATVTF